MSTPPPNITLREPQPGDMGWVIAAQAQVYAKEYGFNQEFEALVAEIAAKFLRQFKPEWERCWIAELQQAKPAAEEAPPSTHAAQPGGTDPRVGSVFVVRKNRTTAQLRMLVITPQARGIGLGGRLTDEAIAFARQKGYKKMHLWTNANLLAARAIYAKRGFKLVSSEAHHSFGQDLVGEHWELVL